MAKIRSLRCPTCRKIVVRGEPDYPFCSERCRLIDLGKWASGGYVISSPIGEADQISESDYTGNPGEPPPTKPDGKSRNRS